MQQTTGIRTGVQLAMMAIAGSQISREDRRFAVNLAHTTSVTNTDHLEIMEVTDLDLEEGEVI
jgi:hypothetical protein